MDGIRIEKIEITSFGKLKGVILTPSDGLNIIEADNEAGKSTLASFIKFVFYGFSNPTKQSVSENEKIAYSPWDGTPASGAINIASGENKYRIERTQPAGRQSTVKMTDALTGNEVFAGAVPGVVVFGINEETFEKIIYFRQAYIAKNKDEDLAEQISNLLFSADERMNTSAAVEKLKAYRSSLANAQKRGVLPSLEADYSDYSERFEKATQTKAECDAETSIISETKCRISENAAKISVLEKEEENIRKYEAKLRLDGFLKLADERKKAEEKYEQSKRSLACGEVPDREYVDAIAEDNAKYGEWKRQLEETESKIKASEAEISELVSSSLINSIESRDRANEALKNGKSVKTILFVLLAVCLAGVGVSAIFGLGTIMLAAFGGASALFVILFAVMCLSTPSALRQMGFSSVKEAKKSVSDYEKKKIRLAEKESGLISLKESRRGLSEKCAEAEASVKERLEKYIPGVMPPFDGAVFRLRTVIGETEKAKAEFMLISRRLDSELVGEEPNRLKDFSEGATQPKRDKATVERELEFYRRQGESLADKLHTHEIRKAGLESGAESPAILYGKKEATGRKLAEGKRQYASLETAINVIGESADYMHSTVSPKLASLASNHLEGVTGYKYKKITLSTDLKMSIETDFGEKSVDFLSGGARDAVYLCLRHALIDLLYEKNRPFIVLDDAFAHIDDGRLGLFISELVSFAPAQQIFLFTCHKREKSMLDEMRAKYTNLSLN